MNKNLIIGIAVALIMAFLAWLYIASSKPLPGQKQADLGQGHVEVGTEVEYNSNPPTSGKHYVDWIRAGIYETPKDDRNLVHSLEHGYIIMSYNCDYKISLVKTAFAHGIGEETTSGEATDSGSLSDSFRSEDCHKLVDQLISIYEKKGQRKLIIIPRPSLDSKIALTAWTYLDKFNELDMARIDKFIGAHHNMGPEKTME